MGNLAAGVEATARGIWNHGAKQPCANCPCDRLTVVKPTNHEAVDTRDVKSTG